MKKLVVGLMFLGASLWAFDINIVDPYVRATPPNMSNSAAFMTLENKTDKDISLIWAKSEASNVVELHTHEMKDGMMKMYQVPQIDIKASSSTVLEPGGFHIMLIDLVQKPLKEGDEVTITLGFSNEQEETIKVPVKSVMGGMMDKDAHHKCR